MASILSIYFYSTPFGCQRVDIFRLNKCSHIYLHFLWTHTQLSCQRISKRWNKATSMQMPTIQSKAASIGDVE